MEAGIEFLPVGGRSRRNTALMETVAALTDITRRQEHLIAELNHALHGKRSRKTGRCQLFETVRRGGISLLENVIRPQNVQSCIQPVAGPSREWRRDIYSRAETHRLTSTSDTALAPPLLEPDPLLPSRRGCTEWLCGWSWSGPRPSGGGVEGPFGQLGPRGFARVRGHPGFRPRRQSLDIVKVPHRSIISGLHPVEPTLQTLSRKATCAQPHCPAHGQTTALP
jgi:hypothetical protein